MERTLNLGSVRVKFTHVQPAFGMRAHIRRGMDVLAEPNKEDLFALNRYSEELTFSYIVNLGDFDKALIRHSAPSHRATAQVRRVSQSDMASLLADRDARGAAAA